MTSLELQNLIWSHHDAGAGVLSIPRDYHNFGDLDVCIPNEVTLDLNGGIVTYNGKLSAFGFGVRQGTGDHEGGTVRNFKIKAPNGSAVGPHANATSVNDARASGIFPETKLAAINFNRPDWATDRVTGLYISDIRKNGVGTTIDARGNVIHIERIQGGRVLLDGVGSLRDSQVHDGIAGTPQVTLRGTWHIDAWIETIGGMQLTDAHVTTNAATWTAQPKQPVRMTRSRLHVAGDLPFQFDGGITQEQIKRMKLVDRIALIKQCYPGDASSAVYAAGKLVVGVAA